MSNIQVVAETQKLDVEIFTQQIVVDPATSTPTITVPTVSAVSITNAGPVGPPGALGSFDLVPVLEEVDTRIATHNQAEVVHQSAVSGRDFVALFQNGLI